MGQVPDDLWSSIVSYYNNNQLSYHREEWERKGVHVNRVSTFSLLTFVRCVSYNAQLHKSSNERRNEQYV